MPTNLDGKIVRRRAADIAPISEDRLAELRALRDQPIDTSDIPELPKGRRIRRDPDGRTRANAKASIIREAISDAMTRREMTVYALWKKAKAYCPTITETAVGEFIKGKRAIGLDYIEALMMAANLVIVSDSGAEVDPGPDGETDDEERNA